MQIDTELILGFAGWMAATTVALLVAWGRIEVKLSQFDKSLGRLWNEFDELHPRRSNPGHRHGVRHNHEEE